MSTDIGAVLFDLDGTLVDTAPDMAYVLELICREHGVAAPPFERVRPQVSNGATALLKLAFGELAATDLDGLRQRYLEIYAGNLVDRSALFEGIPALLDALDDNDLAWGVVTNKPSTFTVPLLQHLGIAERAGCIVSGDSAARAKPHPDPLLLASRLVAVPASACVYVGDDERDVIAGKAAGMRTVVAAWGYLGTGTAPGKWDAGGIIEHPQELAGHLQLNHRVA